MAKHKIKDFLSHLGHEVKTAVTNAVHSVEHGIETVIHDVEHGAEWIVLAPFKKPMQGVLKARGIQCPDKIDDVAKAFFSEIVQKNHFDHFTIHQAAVRMGKHSGAKRKHHGRHHLETYDHFLHFHFLEHADKSTAIEGGITAAGAAAAGATGGISLAVSQVINAVIEWFKKKKAAKDAGQQLPPDEQKAVNDADKLTSGDPPANSPGTGSGNDIPNPPDFNNGIFMILLWIVAGFVLMKMIF